MAHDVFLSYSYQDKASADAVCHSLESKGIRCWIAPRDVIPGENWQQSILDAIAEARAVILIFTGHTNQSENVKKEVSAAFDANAMVIPFRIEDVSPQGSLKYVLIGVHWLDAYLPPLEEHISHLAKIIQNLPPKNGETQHEPIPVPLPPAPSPAPPQPQPQPTPGPDVPTRWDAVPLDRREGFAFLAAIIPFAPGLYLLWRTTYRNDGDKVAPVSRTRKIIATALAVLVIVPVLLVTAQLLKGHGGSDGELSGESGGSSNSSAAASASVAESSAVSSSSASSSAVAAPTWSSASTDGKDRQIKFVNQSDHTLYHIFAWSTDQSESAGHDLMPEADTIGFGQTKAYTVDDGANHCNYNFKATRADNASPLYVQNVEVCGTEQVTFRE